MEISTILPRHFKGSESLKIITPAKLIYNLVVPEALMALDGRCGGGEEVGRGGVLCLCRVCVNAFV